MQDLGFTFLDLISFYEYSNPYVYHYFKIVSIRIPYGRNHKKSL